MASCRGTILLLLLLVVGACTSQSNPPDPVPPAPKGSYFERLACGLPREQLWRTWEGYYPGRSGDILAAGERDDRVFSAAFPSEIKADLPCLADR